MRYFWILFVAVIGLLVASCGGPPPTKPAGTMRLVFITENYSWSAQETDEWRTFVSDSLLLLPDDMLQIMKTGEEGKTLTFYINPYQDDKNARGLGVAGGGAGGDIMLFASNFKNKSTAEKMFAIIHELGHIYHDTSERFDVLAFMKAAIDQDGYPAEDIPTTPAFKNEEFFNKERTLILSEYDPREDYADSFALFVLWPEKLKECCQIRYDFLKNAFGKEYTVFPEITESNWIKAILIREILKQGINVELKP